MALSAWTSNADLHAIHIKWVQKYHLFGSRFRIDLGDRALFDETIKGHLKHG